MTVTVCLAVGLTLPAVAVKAVGVTVGSVVKASV